MKIYNTILSVEESKELISLDSNLIKFAKQTTYGYEFSLDSLLDFLAEDELSCTLLTNSEPGFWVCCYRSFEYEFEEKSEYKLYAVFNVVKKLLKAKNIK